MKWDIPQFKALIDGLFDVKEDSHPKEFLILADAFDEQEDERGKFLRRYLKYPCGVGRIPEPYRPTDYWNDAYHYVRTITHLHPFEYALRGSHAYWRCRRNYPDQWIVPGAKWDFKLTSVLEIAKKNQWHYDLVCRAMKKLNKNGFNYTIPDKYWNYPHILVPCSSFKIVQMDETNFDLEKLEKAMS